MIPGVGDQPGQHRETPPTSPQKNLKVSLVWWCTPVIPATPEAEVEGLFEPRSLRLPLATVTPLHSGLGNRARPTSKKERGEREREREKERT